MHEVSVAIDAGHAALGEHGMRFTTSVALRPDRVGIVTLAAGDTVPAAEISESFLLQPGASCLPDLGVAEIVRQFNKHIAHAGRDMDIGLDKPIARGGGGTGRRIAASECGTTCKRHRSMLHG